MSLRHKPSREYHQALDRRLGPAFEALRKLRQPVASFSREHDDVVRQQFDIETFLRRPAHNGWKRCIRRKKGGEEEPVWSPCEELRELQAMTFNVVFPKLEPSNVATAFESGSSIIRNAKPHQSNRSSFRIDIKGAFPSIRTNNISAFLLRHGVNEDLAWVLARLWTYRGRLEQGAPIAPKLFNAMLARLDADLLAEVGDGIVYTRYGDDMCFSCTLDEFPAELEARIRAVVERHGFRVNGKKTRRGRNGIVDLPGIVIKNGRIRPNGAYVRKVTQHWREFLPKQLKGHRAYVAGFGHGGQLRIFKTCLAPI